MYDDLTPMPLGKYKFTKIIDIPIDYLVDLSKSCEIEELKEWLVNNVERIRLKQLFKEGEPDKPFCGKVVFPNEEAANRRMVEINKYEESKYKHKREKRPCRKYYCEVCGGWHLTSKPSNQITN